MQQLRWAFELWWPRSPWHGWGRQDPTHVQPDALLTHPQPPHPVARGTYRQFGLQGRGIRPHCLMYLVLPLKSKPWVTCSFRRHMRYRLHEPKFWLEPNHSGGIAGTCGRPVLWRIGKSDPRGVRRTGPPIDRRQRRRLERCQHEGRPSVAVVSVELYSSLIRVQHLIKFFTCLCMFAYSNSIVLSNWLTVITDHWVTV